MVRKQEVEMFLFQQRAPYFHEMLNESAMKSIIQSYSVCVFVCVGAFDFCGRNSIWPWMMCEAGANGEKGTTHISLPPPSLAHTLALSLVSPMSVYLCEWIVRVEENTGF